MKKKLDTRFPASRIKRIMQTDEDVGKIALAVPLLVSKALELFLQDLCDRTYDVTRKNGAKTLNSSHLKHCVHNFSVFDFLKETVSRVPEPGFSDVSGEDRSSKRRKAVDGEGNITDEEPKRSKREMVHSSRRWGGGRGRHRRRVSDGSEWDTSHQNKCEDGPETSHHQQDKVEHGESEFSRTEPKEDALTGPRVPVRDFDLNLGLDENGLATAIPASPSPAASAVAAHEMKREEYNARPPSTVTMDRRQVVSMDGGIDEEEEDYDEED